MSDVACVCCAPLIAEVRPRGLQAEQLVEGLPLQVAELENPRRRIPWDAFTVFARRASDMLGGPEAIEDVAARSATQTVPRMLQRLLPRFGSARLVYLVGARWWGPWVFRGTRASCEEIADGRLREVIEILPEYAECPEFFQGVRGVLRSMPRLFGQAEAVVDLDQDGRRGEFIIAPPPARRRRLQLRANHRTPEDFEELAELGFRQDQLRESERRTRAAVVLLAERSRQLETLRRLHRTLGEQPDGRERIAAIVRLLEREFSMEGIRLSSIGPTDEAFERRVEAGQHEGAPSRSHTLRVGRRDVGRLELWGFEEGERAPGDAARLEELLPWIAIALESLRSGDEVERLSHLLAEDVADWQRLEWRLDRLLRAIGCEKLDS